MSEAEFTRRLRLWIRKNPREFEQWVLKYVRINGGLRFG